MADLWMRQRRDALFLYVHLPFCDMRCGFCNLFTRARPERSLVDAYLSALRRQAGVVREALDDASFARLASGGGTPTYLDPKAIEMVLDVVEHVMGAELGRVPFSVEASPGTVSAEKLQLLADRGTTRLSIGVETFVEAEAAAVNRPQRTDVVEKSLELIRQSRIPALNIDLIYGLPEQTVASWLSSITAALRFAARRSLISIRSISGRRRRSLARRAPGMTCGSSAIARLGPFCSRKDTRRSRCGCSAPLMPRPKRARLTAARKTAWSVSAAARGRTRPTSTTRPSTPCGARGVRGNHYRKLRRHVRRIVPLRRPRPRDCS